MHILKIVQIAKSNFLAVPFQLSELLNSAAFNILNIL